MRNAVNPSSEITVSESSNLLFGYNTIEEAKSNTWTDIQKSTCLELFRNMAYLNGQKDLYLAFEKALYPDISSIAVVFTQGDNIYGSEQSLDQFRGALVVTATRTDGTKSVVDAYNLEGVLSLGTNTVTVRYAGKTATFEVDVDYLYVLHTDNFKRNTALASKKVSGQSIPYIQTGSTASKKRLSYIDFDILLAGGKTYEFKTTVTENYQSTAGIGIQTYNEAFYNDGVNWTSANHENDVDDQGWQTLNCELTLPATINGSPTKGVRFTLRQSDSNPQISSDFAVQMLTIREVE